MKKLGLISLVIVLVIALVTGLGLTSCGPESTPPAAPTGLNCEAVSSTQIDLSWDASSGATGYYVYHCTGTTCTPTTVVYAGAGTSCSDTGLTPNTTYSYRVAAYNEAGESGYLIPNVCCATREFPEVEWTMTIGGAADDCGYSVLEISYGLFYIIAGYTYSSGAGGEDVWLIETVTPENQVQWDKKFGGEDWDAGHSVQQTSDGGYIIAGYTFFDGSTDVWLIKTGPVGFLQWDKKFGRTLFLDGEKYLSEDYGYSAQQTSDGGYIITGYTFFQISDSEPQGVWLIKTDPQGNKVWDMIFDLDSDTDLAMGYSVQQTSDGGYIIVGTTDQMAGADVWLIKTNSVGNWQWDKKFGGSDCWDVGYSVQQTSDGGYIIAGWTGPYGATGYTDVWLIKTNSVGNWQWDKKFGGPNWDAGHSVKQTTDGGYIITGWTDSYGDGNFDVWLIRTDPQGKKRWDETFGGSDDDFGHSVQQTSDGGYIIAGSTYSFGAGGEDVWLIKIAVK